MSFRIVSVLLAPLVTSLVIAQAPASPTESAPQSNTAQAEASRQPDATRRELMQLAASAFADMPLVPHEKNRSRGQMEVVEAAIEFGDLELAASLADKISDWRRGLAHAACALHLAKVGEKKSALEHAAIAEGIARRSAADANEQSWRPARVFATLARMHLVLGDLEAFGRFSKDLEPADAAAIQRDAALAMPEGDFDRWLARADEEFKGTNFDSIVATLESCAALFDRFFADVGRRDALQKRVLEGYPKLPRDARLKLILQVARTAAIRGDGIRALDLVHEAERIVVGVRFHAEDEVYLKARIAGVTCRAGDTAEGKKRLDDVQRLYDANEKTILDIYRAAALRAIAEAALDADLQDRALSIYAKALEAGLSNPNSRPRADDVAATCLSMARRGVEPTPELGKRLREIVNGLRDPW